ncbi:MAG: 3-oxoacyl-[acyl-carrier-protein] synthase III C-terminal domain-containing protein [Chloroflexota bacterium]
MNTIIESLGVYLPPTAVTTDEVLQGCKVRLPIPLERLTGIRSRRIASPGQTAIDLAREAVQSCLARSRYAPTDIDVLISCSISKTHAPGTALVEPTLAFLLQQAVGLSNAQVFDVTNACAGMFTGIAVADAMLKAGGAGRIMVVSGEWSSHVMETAQREISSMVDQRIPCLTVGDAGAAVILELSPDERIGFHTLELYTLAKYSGLCIVKPTDREHGGLIMVTDSIRISLASIPQAVQHLATHLGRQGWSLDDLGHLIPHQTSRTSLQDAARQLSVRVGYQVELNGKNVDNLTDRGNTATTTHLVALEDAILDGRIKSGEHVAFSITGSGITIGTGLYTFDDLPDRRRRWEQEPQPVAKVPAVRTGGPNVLRLGNRVRVESIGTATDVPTKHDSLELVRAAALRCLAESSHARSEIGLLIYAGLYRLEQIIEPAIATLIAGELALNEDVLSPVAPKTLAFDLLNSGLGFLNACQAAGSMIAAGALQTAMIVASEVESDGDDPLWPRLGIREVGSAVILDGTGTAGPGFDCFAVLSYPEYRDAVNMYVQEVDGRLALHVERHAWISELILECIADAVPRFLRAVGLTLADIDVILPPQISPLLSQALAEQLGVPQSKLVDVSVEGQDLFTSSLPFALAEARRRGLTAPGNVGLVIVAGSGIQVGCALYYF